MARGAFPDSHRQHLGMPGMHGTVAAVTALQKADLLIALGARFDDRVTGKLDSFAPDAQVIHADIDPAEISKNRHADVPIVGDAREVISRARRGDARRSWQHTPQADLARTGGPLDAWSRRYPLGYTEPDDGSLAPQYVIERLGEIAGPDAIYVAGVGQHQMWAAQFISYENPARGSTPVGSARWATPSRRPWARRSGVPTPPSGRSTATAASR
jgi:acetolactate synthase I/II/III large subunit